MDSLYAVIKADGRLTTTMANSLRLHSILDA
jgi:hypothetical protein